MKKKTLDMRVKEYKNETSIAIITILESISSPGQLKKLLENDKVKSLLEKYEIEV